MNTEEGHLMQAKNGRKKRAWILRLSPLKWPFNLQLLIKGNIFHLTAAVHPLGNNYDSQVVTNVTPSWSKRSKDVKSL